mgnify:CR=1 FL=1
MKSELVAIDKLIEHCVAKRNESSNHSTKLEYTHSVMKEGRILLLAVHVLRDLFSQKTKETAEPPAPPQSMASDFASLAADAAQAVDLVPLFDAMPENAAEAFKVVFGMPKDVDDAWKQRAMMNFLSGRRAPGSREPATKLQRIISELALVTRTPDLFLQVPRALGVVLSRQFAHQELERRLLVQYVPKIKKGNNS